jgi:hypothetical protein
MGSVDQQQKLTVYNAQVKNVRRLESAIRHIRRSINLALRKNDEPAAMSFTAMYAILFCAWAEANFSKLIHTPYGFDLGEIDQIKVVSRTNGVVAGWQKSVELGLRHLDASRGNFLPNTRQQLERAIDAYVFDPSVLRNKLAHGQLAVALNRENDDIQQELTSIIAGLNIVKIDGWKFCHEHLAGMIENLIESPVKSFPRDWWAAVVALEEEIEQFTTRTLVNHVGLLKDKDVRTEASRKSREKL